MIIDNDYAGKRINQTDLKLLCLYYFLLHMELVSSNNVNWNLKLWFFN